jgi:beta-glucosidase
VQAKLKSKDIKYTVGAHSHKWLPLLGPQVKFNNKPGVSFKSYNELPSVPNREAADELHLLNTHMLFLDYKSPRLKSQLWYADITAIFTADESGTYEFGLCVYGTAKLYIDDKLVINNETTQRQGTAFFGTGTLEETGTVRLKRGQLCAVKVEFASAPTSKLPAGGVTRFHGGGVRIGCTRIFDPEEEIRKAAELARTADQVIICTGLNVRALITPERPSSTSDTP